MNLRPLIPIVLIVPLAACSGFGHFLGDTVWIDTNRNAPDNRSENGRRAWGEAVDVQPLKPEAGDVWPGPLKPEPTLEDIAAHPDAYPLPKLEMDAGTPHPQPRPASQSSSPRGAPLAQSGDLAGGLSRGGRVDSNGSPDGFRVITKPGGGNGGVIIPNGNGTSTIIAPDGSVTTIPNASVHP